jgi:hypothetical protein
MLHFLCSQLNALGHKATVYIYSAEQVTNFGNPIGHDPEAVVIYPEVVTNNPLNAKKVVRYLLNKEAAIDGKPIDWGINDFPMAYSKLYKDCDTLFYPIIDTEISVNRNEPREYNSYYVGKGNKYAICPPLPGCKEVLINNSINEFVNILNKSRIFFTYDTLSSSNIDAVLCGAMPYFLLKPPKELKNAEYGKFWIESMDAEEIAQVKEHNKNLKEQILENQKTFPKRLAKIVNKIETHFKDI